MNVRSGSEPGMTSEALPGSPRFPGGTGGNPAMRFAGPVLALMAVLLHGWGPVG